MKLAFATFAAALISASAASAMITPYDLEINAKVLANQIETGTVATVDVSNQQAGPSGDWTVSGEKTVTVFDAGMTDAHAKGFHGR